MTRRTIARLTHRRLAAATLCVTVAPGLAAAGAIPAAGATTLSATTPTSTAHTPATHTGTTPSTSARPGFFGDWAGTWAASPMEPSATASSPTSPSVVGFDNQTVREIVHVSIGGSALRLRLSNTFSSQPVTIGAVTVAAQGTGAALASTPVPVRFGFGFSVQIPAGGEVLSDPVPMQVTPLENLAVSLFFPDATGQTTYHAIAEQQNYISTPGNHTADPTATPFTQNTSSWYYLSGVDVHTSGPSEGSVVALGDSITDGFRSTASTNSRWPDGLARRLAAAHIPLGVLNEGISGNRVLNNSVCFGISALSRLEEDVLDQAVQADAHTVILLEGINDIGFPTMPNAGCTAPNTFVSTQQIINGYRQIIAEAHAHGMRVIGATLTPIEGSFYDTPATEAERTAVNAWIRTSHAFDGVIDFDAAVRDPSDPQRILPAFDSGDHLHPNDAGYAAMASAINLAMLQSHAPIR